VLLPITGANGVGKSTARALIAPELSPAVECVELLDLSERPAAVTWVWRQQTAQAAVRRAVDLKACGRHRLLGIRCRLSRLSPHRQHPAPAASDDCLRMTAFVGPEEQCTRLRSPQQWLRQVWWSPDSYGVVLGRWCQVSSERQASTWNMVA
jgi:hypothetical protein